MKDGVVVAAVVVRSCIRGRRWNGEADLLLRAKGCRCVYSDGTWAEARAAR